MKPDILIFMSDQQDGRIMGCMGDGNVRTPNLDALAGKGTLFESAYSSCPVCVPARAGFLSGQLPCHNHVYSNNGALGVDHATFLHCLVAQGYETVLVGRMHFIGPDQRHGFTRRVGADFCHPFWPTYAADDEWMQNIGSYVHTTGQFGALRVVGGGGVSPTREYDKAVIGWAESYLQEDHDKPQCVVVGTYGPHFPYVGRKELFEAYLSTAELPRSFNSEPGEFNNPLYKPKQQFPDDKQALAAQAAYRALIEEQDELFGRVMEAWTQRRNRSNRSAVTVFTSDHGDTCGEHNLYGKQTFFEGSSHIPMIVAGDGFRQGQRVASPVSLLDLAATATDLTGAVELPTQDGCSLLPQLRAGQQTPDRSVVVEYIYQACPARMVRQGDWKLMHFANDSIDDMLFNLAEDPDELDECSARYPDVVTRLKQVAHKDWEPGQVLADKEERDKHHQILRAAGPAVGGPADECWMGYAGKVRLPDANGSFASEEAREIAGGKKYGEA